MKFLKVLGWIVVPYIMIFVSWKRMGGGLRALGTVWALIALLIGIGSANGKPQNQAAPAVAPATQASVVNTAAAPKAAEPAPAEKPKEEPKKEEPKNKPSMSKAEFDELKNGISYDEATKIIGGPGEVISESGDVGSEFHTIMYQYKGEGGMGANANLMFQGGKMMNKAQFGLK